MTKTKPNPIIHLLPSLTDVAFLMPLVFMFTKMDGAKALLGDGDTGWHIRTGEWILANHQVPYRDIFSFTKPGQPWFAWEWLSDVVFAYLHQLWGLAGVVALGMLILCLTSALLFRLVRRHCPDPIIAIAFTYLAIAASSIHWHARPHLFTLLFVVIFLHVLDRVQDGRTRLLWWLPFLTVVWTNLHGGFFVGIFILACYAAGECVAWFTDSDERRGRGALHKGAAYAGAAVACGFASLLNPYTYHLHLFIAKYLNAPFLDGINEFMSISFRPSAARTFELLLLSAVALIGWTLARRRYAAAILVTAWAHLALIAGRNIPLFGLIAAPVVAQGAYELLGYLSQLGLAHRIRRIIDGFTAAGADFAELDHPWRAHVVSFCSFSLVLFAITSAATPKFTAAFDGETFPVAAVSVLQQRGTGKTFTRDQWADYLIYRLYPNVRVYMDGRSDFYGGEFVDEYINIKDGKHGWDKPLERYSVTRALLGVDDGLTAVLKSSPQWRVVYDDHKAIVFEKVMPGYQQVSCAQSGRQGRDPRITSIQRCDPKITATVNRDLRVTNKSL